MLNFENKKNIQLIDYNRQYFLLTDSSKININKINLKTTYNDILFFIKIFNFNLNDINNLNKKKYLFNNNINNASNINKNFSLKKQINKIDIKTFNISLISQGIEIILIDDHSNTFYPFLLLNINEIKLFYEYMNEFSNSINIFTILNIMSYNYYAGEWEPLLENTSLYFDILNDKSDKNNIIHTYNITNKSSLLDFNKETTLNMNISDLSLTFLIRTLNNWIKKLKINFSKKNQKIVLNSDMILANHTLYNYTGKNLMIYKNNNLINKLKSNKNINIEYFEKENDNNCHLQSNNNNNLITIEFEELDRKILNNKINVDDIKIKKIYFEPYQKDNPYNYLVSKINFKYYPFMRKFIYLYSPLTFKNKTDFKILFTLICKSQPNINIIIEPNSIIGITYEYLSGLIHISLFNEKKIMPKIFRCFSFLNSNSNLLEEFKLANSFFILKKNLTDNYVNIINAYKVINCLPFDITLILKEQNEIFTIKKNLSANISSISYKKNFKCFIYLNNFHSNKEVILVNKENGKFQRNVIKLEDNENNNITIYSEVLNENRNSIYTIILFCGSVIINHSGLLCETLKFYYINDINKLTLIPNQLFNYNFFLINDYENKLIVLKYFGKNEEEVYISQIINISAIGTRTLVTLQKEQKILKKKKFNDNLKNENKIEFIVEISLSLINKIYDLYTNIIKIVPKYIIYNKLDLNINMKILTIEEYKNNNVLEILNNSKFPIYFFNQNEKENFVEFQLVDKNDKNNNFKCSQKISITNCLYFQTLKFTSLNGIKTKYINIEKKLDDISTYLIITEANFLNCQIIIENYSSLINCLIYQRNYIDYSKLISFKSKSLFCFENLYDNNNVIISFSNKNGVCFSNSYIYDLNESKENYVEIIKLNLRNKNKGHLLLLSIYSEDGNKFIIRIKDYIENINLKNNEIYEFNINITNLGLSLLCDNRNTIDNTNNEIYRRKEICYFYLEDIIFYVKSNINFENSYISHEIQLLIKEIEIDNEISYLKSFPLIMFSKKKYKQINNLNFSSNSNNSSNKESKINITEENQESNITNSSNSSENNNNQPFFNFAIYCTTTNNSNIIKINLLNYLIQSFYLIIESNVLEGLLKFMNNITI